MNIRLFLIMTMLTVAIGAMGQSRYEKNIEKAKQGDAKAQYQVGYSYRVGDGVAKDDSQVFYWYRKSADQGYSYAQQALGVCYHDAVGVARDYTQAVYWYRKAAEQGHAGAQVNLGAAYITGEGIAKDPAQGVYWYKKAAEQGHKMGQNNLAVCYHNGTGVAKDDNQAVYWYRKAADQGYDKAQYGLANRYYFGEGVPQDYSQAVYWYRKAADQGHVDAKKWLAKAEEKLKEQNLANNTQTDSLTQSEKTDVFEEFFGEFFGKKKIASTSSRLKQSRKEGQSISSNVSPVIPLTKDSIKQNSVLPDVDKNIPAVGRTNENLFAVVIGNEHYKNEADVPFAENDAKVFKEYVQKTLGVPEKQIRFVANAGLNDLRGAVRWLSQAMDVCDGQGRAIFYYAGHGIPDEEDKTAHLLPVDGDGSDAESGYSLSRLYAELSKMPSQRVTVFLDACFSGAKRDGDMMASARGVAIKTKSTEPTGKLVIFTAAQEDETAFPYKEKGHGMFTYYLLKKLQDTRGEATLGELGDYLTKEVKRQSFVENNKMQTPSVSSKLGAWRSMKMK